MRLSLGTEAIVIFTSSCIPDREVDSDVVNCVWSGIVGAVVYLVCKSEGQRLCMKTGTDLVAYRREHNLSGWGVRWGIEMRVGRKRSMRVARRMERTSFTSDGQTQLRAPVAQIKGEVIGDILQGNCPCCI